MPYRFGLVLLALSALAVLWHEPARPADQPAKVAAPKNPERIDFAKQVVPILDQYCNRCHSGAKPRGGIALDRYKDDAAALKDLGVWDRVAQRLRAHEMPPAKRPQPKQTEADQITSWVDGILGTTDCVRIKNPGRVTLRRLNRTEYNNTIRDLVGVNFRPADDFPADDVGYGFDNIGDVLSLPPLLLEKYLAAAEKIVTAALDKPETRARILFIKPTDKNKDECARKILERFARRAYRRPLATPEVERLAGFVKLAEAQGDSFEKGIELALEAILTSPHFLFRIERDPRRPKEQLDYQVNEYELATRLSYFLWSTMPDAELFSLAEQGALRKNLVTQVRRMLRDFKAHALVENFAGQWLQLRNLKNVTPDPDLFPKFDEALRAAMLGETERFFESIVAEDRSVLDFLDADFTFLNERLARHYGIVGIKGDQFQRVSLKGGPRGGIVTQASILTITSNPTRTSPVKRGKWILENILGTPPPPPPPGAGELSEDKKVVLSGSLRKRMEQHRANPNCATCHQRMDPLGFGLENFDAVGGWRDRDGEFPIDASGVLPDGKSFQGPTELKAILKGKHEAFCRCLTERLVTYALGRGLEAYDKCALDEITKGAARNGYRFSSLVIEIVKSDPFQKRRGRRGDK
jgi:hypothetical protein